MMPQRAHLFKQNQNRDKEKTPGMPHKHVNIYVCRDQIEHIDRKRDTKNAEQQKEIPHDIFV